MRSAKCMRRPPSSRPLLKNKARRRGKYRATCCKRRKEHRRCHTTSPASVRRHNKPVPRRHMCLLPPMSFRGIVRHSRHGSPISCVTCAPPETIREARFAPRSRDAGCLESCVRPGCHRRTRTVAHDPKRFQASRMIGHLRSGSLAGCWCSTRRTTAPRYAVRPVACGVFLMAAGYRPPRTPR